MHLKGCESTTCASSKAFVFFFARGNPVLAQSPEEAREVLRTGVGIHDLSGELREGSEGERLEARGPTWGCWSSPMVMGS